MMPRRLPWLRDIRAQLPPLAARGVHALLLHGMRGVGKKCLGFDFAESLLCRQPIADGRGCGECDECRLVAAGTHPDLRWVLPQSLAERLLPQAQDNDQAAPEAASEETAGDAKSPRASREIRVEQIRALSDFLGIAAYRGGRRVVLLAPAEAMNAIAANTLLKMLEEPPPETLFILVSDAVDDVLPTIRSRCVLVQVPPPQPDACLPWLAEQGVEDPASALALASGGPLAALPDAVPEGLSSASAALYRLLERGPALTPAQVTNQIGRDAAVPACVRLMQCWAFDLLQHRVRGSVRYHPAQRSRIGRLSDQARLQALWRWIDLLGEASAVREHPLNPRLVIETLLTAYINVFDEGR